MSAHPSSEPTPSRLVDAFEAGRRARSVAEANEIRLLADAAAAVARPANATPAQTRRAELDRRALIADLATSTRTSEWTVTRLLTESTDLCTRFARGVDALERGEISRAHLAVIHDVGDPISDEQARDEFLTIALDRATHLTPGRLAPALRVIAERFQDRTLDERHADAVARRSVEVTDLPGGLAALTLTHDATLVHGIHDRLTAQARSVIAARESGDSPTPSAERPGEDAAQGGAGPRDGAIEGAEGAGGTDRAEGVEGTDTRTMAQLRADVAADVLLSAGPDDCVAGSGLDAIRATVQVTVPVLTMAGASDEPALLAGYGPIDTETARRLAAGATGWERVMTSPVTGAVMCVDRYRPGRGLDRFLAARDEHCRFPGCRQPVWRCDVDHTIGAACGGPTHHANLAHLCRRHHVLKTIEAWTAEQIRPGILVWTSPTGRKHTDRPEAVVRFVADPEILARRRVMREPWAFAAASPPGAGAPF